MPKESGAYNENSFADIALDILLSCCAYPLPGGFDLLCTWKSVQITFDLWCTGLKPVTADSVFFFPFGLKNITKV